jgi:hypothetical protein
MTFLIAVTIIEYLGCGTKSFPSEATAVHLRVSMLQH